MLPEQSQEDFIHESMNTRLDLGKQLDESKELFKALKRDLILVEQGIDGCASKATQKISFKSSVIKN